MRRRNWRASNFYYPSRGSVKQDDPAGLDETAAEVHPPDGGRHGPWAQASMVYGARCFRLSMELAWGSPMKSSLAGSQLSLRRNGMAMFQRWQEVTGR